MAEADEPTFDIDDLINELLFDPDDNRMETPSASMSSSQQNNPIEIVGSYQAATPTSDVASSMSRNPENSFGYGSIGGPSNYPVGERFPNTSSSAVSQLDQHHLLHHHSSAQFVERTNNYPPSALLNAYLTDNQRQQQQRSLRNLSPFIMTRNQESCGSDAQQAAVIESEMESQLIARQWQMEKVLNMQSRFPQSQNVSLAHPMKSENDHHQFLQGPPLGCPFEAPWESSIQVKMANSSDWVEHAVHQIRYLKEIYLPEVVSLYSRANELRNQTPNPKTVALCGNAMVISKSTHTFLHMSRAEIFCDGKENISRGMDCLSLSLNRIREMNFHLMQHAASSSSQLKTAQLQQRGGVPKLYGTSPSLVQRGFSSEPSSVSSLQVGSSSGIEHYAFSSPRNSSLIGYDQGFSNMPPHSSTGDPQQLYMSDLEKIVASSQNINNSSISPITRDSLMTNSENNNRSNVIKSTEQLMSERHMQQIMQKSNGNSAMRDFMTFNKSSSFEVPSPRSSSLTELSEFRTSSLPASKRTLPSTLNPLTPSSKWVNSEKSLLSFEEGGSPAQPESQLKDLNQNHSVLDSQKLWSCPSDLLEESTCPDRGESSIDKRDNRLIKVVKSMPPEELNPTVPEMSAVANIKDITRGSFPHVDPTVDTVNDLATDSRKCKDQENCKLLCGTSVDAKMKRQMNSIDLRTEMEDHASDMVKRPRKQANNHQLLQEIREINQKLVEVVVDARAGRDEGMFNIRCSYRPTGLRGNNSLANTSLETFPVLELTVTADYPRSSPVIVETEPTCCSASEERKEMWKKAMLNFNSALRKSPQPVSLKEMVKTWVSCAREVYRQFAQRNGGGDLSSKYGKWETRVAAS